MVGLVVLSRLVPEGKRPAPAAAGDLPRLAVLVVAHDEERVVGSSVTSLLAQRYPRDRFEVICVADRCSDRTADVARSLGATVLERGPEHEGRGKAFAVAFGVDAILARGVFDAVAVFDADNAVDPEFLHAVSVRLVEGERVVQGLVDAKNPDASWVAASSALGFWALATVNQGPRGRLGLSCPLMGTGFAMAKEEAAEYLRGAGSLTDDLELGARLALAGIPVAYEPEARTLDEKPVRMDTAVSQRHRWMQGRFAVAERYVPPLVARALGPSASDGPPASIAERLRALDVAFQLVAPSLLFTGVALAGVGGAGAVLRLIAPRAALRLAGAWPLGALAAGALFYTLPALGIARFRPPARVWLHYAVQPLYLALSAPLALRGWLERRSGVWRRTEKGGR
jgi:hypothetical protein